MAARLASALGEDERAYRAWARVLARCDLGTMLEASSIVRDQLAGWDELVERGPALPPQAHEPTAVRVPAAQAGHAAPASGGTSPPRASTERGEARLAFVLRRPPRVRPSLASPARARLRVPLIREGDDPGSELHPVCEVVRMLRIDLARVPGSDRWVRPVAYTLSQDSASGLPGTRPGQIALVSRSVELPLPDVPHAIRHRGRVMLARARWNGRELLLATAPESEPLERIPVMAADDLRARIVGRVVGVIDPGPDL